MSFVAISVGTAAVGAAQAVGGAIKQGNATKALENLQTPTTTSSKPISDYYQEALNRYGVSPYNSRLYQMQSGNVAKNLATGLNAATNRRMGTATAGALNQQANDADLRAATAAEANNTQRFAQVGQATGMKANDDKYVFGINKMLPYQKSAQLYSLKAGAGGQELNAGLGTINSAAGDLAEVSSAQKAYGIPQGLKKKPTLNSYGYGNVDLSGEGGY